MIRYFIYSICLLGSVTCQADDFSLSMNQSWQSSLPVTVYQAEKNVAFSFSDIMYALLFESGVKANLAEDSWLSADDQRPGVVISQLKGAVHVQYRF